MVVPASRPEMFEPKGERVIGVGCIRTVAVVNRYALGFRVVIDVAHKRLGCRHAAEVHIYTIQEARWAIAGTDDACIWRRQRYGAIESIIGGAAGEYLFFQCRRLRPVHIV